MRPRSSELRRSRPNRVARRNIMEIVVVIAASASMALMVLGSGIAAERWTSVEDIATDGAVHTPPPLSWREST